MVPISVDEWLEENTLEGIEVDCAISVMLKILDGKCKMAPDEKKVMTALYDALCGKKAMLLDDQIYELIRVARNSPDESNLQQVYEQRLLAETMIARPRMKAFKSKLRQTGLLPNSNGSPF